METMQLPVTPPDTPRPTAVPLTTLVPVYNEAGSIATVLRECHDAVIRRWGGQFLVCEDGSTDGTPELLAKLAPELRLTVHSGPSRKGYARAVRDGLALTDTPWVFFTDSDGQYDPLDFGRLESAIADCDMVIGRKVQRQERFYRVLLSYGFHFLARAFTDVPLKDMDCGFRLIRREVIESVLPDVRSLPYSFWAEFSIVAYRRGFRIREVPISHRARLVGSSSIYRWNKLPRILMAQALGLLRLGSRMNQESKSPDLGRLSGLAKRS
jgi:glycosyltransferase involved in cell wall biosynthesis